jgi:lysophospholipase L1-like esterase
MSGTAPGRLRRATLAALLALASLAAALVATELALRLAGFSFQLRPERVEFGWPKSLATLGAEYRTDRDLLWVRADYAATLERAHHERPQIAFLGDSCTEFGGYDAPLLARLTADRPAVHWTAANLATAGWSTYQGLRQMRRDVVPLAPRLATIYYGWNDHWIGFGLEDAQVARLLAWTGSGWQRLRLVQLLEKAIVARRSDPRVDQRRVPLPDFRRNLTAMVDEARAHGIEPVLVTAPSSHRQGREPEYLRGVWLRRLADLVPLHRRYVEQVRAVAAERHAALCDLAADFAALPERERHASFLKDGIHFTRRGAQRAADYLADCLERGGAIDRLAARSNP